MEPINTATSILTATTLVFAGSSFLLGQLQTQVADLLEDDRARQYERAAYLSTAAGFGFMILTTIALVSVIAPNISEIIDLPDRVLIGVASYTFLAAIAFPAVAGAAICGALYRQKGTEGQ